MFKFCKSTDDSVIEGGGECNTPVLTPLTLKIHDTYIVNNLGAELKAKAPPSIWLCCVSIWEWSPMVIGTYGVYLIVASCKHAF